MFYRIIGTLMGFLIAYATVYFGDFLRPYLFEDWYLSVPSWNLLLIATLGGASLLGSLVVGVVDGGQDNYRSNDVLPMALLALVCLCLPIGVLAQPFTHYGLLPLRWGTPWLFLLLVAALPSLLALGAHYDAYRSLRRDSDPAKKPENANEP